MAMANITGNPKRTIGTILTMGFSCVLFVIISNYVGNIDTEHEARLSVNHGQFELHLDYSAEYDERYPENNLDTLFLAGQFRSGFYYRLWQQLQLLWQDCMA